MLAGGDSGRSVGGGSGGSGGSGTDGDSDRGTLTAVEFDTTLRVFHEVYNAARRAEQHERHKAPGPHRPGRNALSMPSHVPLTLRHKDKAVSYMLYLKTVRPAVRLVDVCDVGIFPQVDPTTHQVEGIILSIQPHYEPHPDDLEPRPVGGERGGGGGGGGGEGSPGGGGGRKFSSHESKYTGSIVGKGRQFYFHQ